MYFDAKCVTFLSMNPIESSELFADLSVFLAEDIGRGDITTQSTVPKGVRGIGSFLAKEDLVICGFSVAQAVFLHLDPSCADIETNFRDGDEVKAGTIFGTLDRLCRCTSDGRKTGFESDAADVGRGYDFHGNMPARLKGPRRACRRHTEDHAGTSNA